MARCHDPALFTGTPPASLCCPFDRGVMRDAIRSTTCGHVFGMRCALDHLLDHDECPVCGVVLDVTCLAPVQHVRDAIFALPVRCPEDRCTWTGALSSLSTHVGSSECAVPRVACPFCHVVFEEGLPFEAHKPLCPEFISICPKCEADMPRRTFAAHVATCTAIPRKIPRLSQLRDDNPAASEEPATEGAAPKPDDVSRVSDGTQVQNSQSLHSPVAQQIGIGVAPMPSHGSHDEEGSLRSLHSVALSSPYAGADAINSRPPRVPTPPVTARSPSPPVIGSASPVVTVPCPFAIFGCESSHSGRASAGDPTATQAVLARHLTLVCAAMTTLQARHNELELRVEALKVQEIRKSRISLNNSTVSNGANHRSNLSSDTLNVSRPPAVSKSSRDTASSSSTSKVDAHRSAAIARKGPKQREAHSAQPNKSERQSLAEGATPTRAEETREPHRPQSTAQPAGRFASFVPPPKQQHGPRQVGGAVRAISNPPTLRPPAAVGHAAPIPAWSNDEATPAAKLKSRADPPPSKSSLTPRIAVKELLELRSAAGSAGIAYKALVSVLPNRSPAKSAENPSGPLSPIRSPDPPPRVSPRQ